MKLFNILFYILLFVGFFLPTNSDFYLPLPGVLLKVNELAFLLMPFINVLCTSKNQVRFKDFKLKRNIVLLIVIVLFTEVVVKSLMYNQSVGEAFKAVRIGIPLFSSLVLLAQGIRADIKVIWKVLLWAIVVSVLLSILSIFITLPIYYNLEAGTSILDESRGRIMNSNASFGIIGLYLLFKDKDKWYNQGLLVKVAAILSIISLILAFNRTYLAILTLAFVYLSFTTLSLRNAFKLISLPVIFLGISIWSYNNIEQVQRQVDKRILSIVLGEITIYESAIESNRDAIYEGILERIDEGHWIIGLPYDKPIFIKEVRHDKDELNMAATDTSVITFLLRYGVIPLLILFLILKKAIKYKYGIFGFCFVFYFLASFNIDSLVKHNSIFFLIILLLISFSYTNDKNFFFSQNQP